jgi:hypothetical protein
VRVTGDSDVAALAALRARWAGGTEEGLEARLRAWLAADGERRTTWLAMTASAERRGLAEVEGEPAGTISLFEYRRMPKPGRPRLVVSPSEEALSLYRRAGFTAPTSAHPLLVRATNSV